MRRVWTVPCLWFVAALAIASGAAAKAPSPAQRTAAAAEASSAHDRGALHRPRHVRARVAYAPRAYSPPRAFAVTRGRRPGLADLVGDPYSGYGFYPLPPEVQVAAARYRFMHRRFWWQNPVLSAVAADAVRFPCYIPANQAYRCGVFNPIDGVGTPFFAGY